MPALDLAGLVKRVTYCNDDFDDNSDCYYNDPWYSYGRWVLLAVIIIGAFLLFLTFSCISARRRRTQNLRPLPLTGWAYSGQQQGYYGNQNQNYQQPPPPTYQASQGFYGGAGAKDDNAPQYGGPPPGSPYGVNAGPSNYPYGGQTSGVEAPEATHAARGGDNVYAPPPGPPPGKGDGVIR